MARWTFTDPVVADAYTFGVGPNQEQPQRQKTIQYQATVAPGGLVLFEGADTPQTLQLQGTILSQTQYQTFVDYFNRRHQVLLTDDKGYQRWVYITQLQFTRKNSRFFPWRHDWQMNMYVLSEAFPANTDNIPPYVHS